MPAEDSEIPGLNVPNSSNDLKCDPNRVSTKARISPFHSLFHGKNGGATFWSGMQKAFPTIPQNGESKVMCQPGYSDWMVESPAHVPVCSKLKKMFGTAEINKP